MGLRPSGPAEVVEAHLRYHVAAGVDLFVVANAGVAAELRDVLGRFQDRLVTAASTGANGSASDWLIRGRSNEFWWPRGGSLRDVLAAAPDDVDAVQGLARRFAHAPDEGRTYFERTTSRLVPSVVNGDAIPARRPQRRFVMRRSRDGAGSGGTELRGWFPLEVLCFPLEGGGTPEQGGLTEDTRVLGALRQIAAGEALSFPRLTALDDPAFGLEIAALTELDVATASRRIDELERRLADLERRPERRIVAGLDRLRRGATGRKGRS